MFAQCYSLVTYGQQWHLQAGVDERTGIAEAGTGTPWNGQDKRRIKKFTWKAINQPVQGMWIKILLIFFFIDQSEGILRSKLSSTINIWV
jgi:hypothetical protein